MHSFTFNGHSSDEFGIRIERFPDLNRSERKYRSASVSGRNGNIYQMQDAWEEVTVSYQIFAGERQDGAAVSDFTDIVEWLNSADDYAVLTDTYDPTHYRMAVFVDELEIESQWHTFGKATVKFRCRPERFIVTNPISVSDGDTITNPTNHIAKPIITLTGNGQMSKINLAKTQNNTAYTGSSFTSTMISNLIDKYFQIYFSYDLSTFTISSTWSITPTYTESTGTLVLSGNSSQGVGILVPVIPSTEYAFSTTCDRSAAYIRGYQISDNGERTAYFGTNVSGSQRTLNLVTGSDTRYLLIVFFKDSANNTTFQNIMLAYGAEVQPFRAYGTATDSTFRFTKNTFYYDASIKITTQGFGTAVIDCETENFSIDGMNDNLETTITDRYGNLSTQYIQLDKGNQGVSFSGDIVSASIDPRFWEL